MTEVLYCRSMLRGKHRQPARGGLHLTKEQLALLAFVGTLAAVSSAATDTFGFFKDDPSPAVSTPGHVNVTASGSPRPAEDYQRVWIETARTVCTNTYAHNSDAWNKCYNGIAGHSGLPLVPAVRSELKRSHVIRPIN